MASFQKTLNLDVLTVKTIYARGPTNTNIPAGNILATDGLGGTLWTSMSSIVQSAYFNTIVTSASTYTARLNINTFTLLNSDSAGIVNVVSTAINTTQLYAKAFGTITTNGYPSLTAFDPNTGTGNNTLMINGMGGINIITNPLTNSILIDGSFFLSSILNLISTITYQYNDITSTINNDMSSFSTASFTDNAASTISSLITYFNDITSTINNDISSLSTASFTDNAASTISSLITYFNDITSTINNDISSLSTASFTDNAASTISSLIMYFNDITSTINNDISSLSTASFTDNSASTISSLITYFNNVTSTIDNEISTVSTSIINSPYISTLYTSSVVIEGNRQPFIQYGLLTLPNSSTDLITSSIIVLPRLYVNTSYITQLTYSSGTNNANLLARITSVSTFIVSGSSNASVNWTTFGNVF